MASPHQNLAQLPDISLLLATMPPVPASPKTQYSQLEHPPTVTLQPLPAVALQPLPAVALQPLPAVTLQPLPAIILQTPQMQTPPAGMPITSPQQLSPVVLQQPQTVDIGRAKARASFLGYLLDIYTRETGITPNFQTYLDVGCGSGEITSEVQDEFDIPETYAADIIPIQCPERLPLDVVESKGVGTVEQKGRKKEPTFILIKDDKIDLPDNSIDLVTAYVAIHHFENYQKMLNEIVRVMKPGGLLFIREHDAKPDKQPFLDLVHSAVMAGRDKFNEEFVQTYFSSFTTKPELIKSLESFGFDFIGDLTYDKSIPNPQNLYHALFVLKDKQEGFTPTPSVTEHRMKYYNLIEYVRKSRDRKSFAKILSKKTGLDWPTVNYLISNSRNDRELFDNVERLRKGGKIEGLGAGPQRGRGRGRGGRGRGGGGRRGGRGGGGRR